ncbi:unnamed protein product, partial [Tetraodon nigroviridis]
RRELMKERLQEKSELEKKALRVVESLLEDSVDEEFLIDAANLMTSAHYKDAIEERSIIKLCGYPVCSNRLGNVPNQKYKISTNSNKVYDLTERKVSNTTLITLYYYSRTCENVNSFVVCCNQCFCSNFCYRASKHFELQLSSTPLWMRKNESGSLGEEVILLEKRLQEKDVEDPQPEQPHSSETFSAEDDLNHSDRAQEQEFISRVFSQPQGPRVHWDSLPKHAKAAGSSEEPSVEEATSVLSVCSLSEGPASPSGPTTSPPSKENRGHPSTGDLPGFRITQVGVSKRGAAGLQGLLKKQPGASPECPRQNLLMCLRGTLKDWCTESTLDFLYGAEHPPGSPSFPDAGEEKEEELDEDDLEDEGAEGIDAAGPRKAPSPVPDFETLRKNTQELELRVREFYKGTWILPDGQETPGEKVTAQDQTAKDPALPLVDSRAQHIIQKRITVEKLTSCLSKLVGPLQLTMNDITTDLNNLVRTFKFTSTNIIHKPPEWTIIAMVLLH